MIKEIGKLLFGLCMFGGFILALGTAGSSDLNLIDLEAITVRLYIALGMFVGGFIGLKICGFKYVQ